MHTTTSRLDVITTSTLPPPRSTTTTTAATFSGTLTVPSSAATGGARGNHTGGSHCPTLQSLVTATLPPTSATTTVANNNGSIVAPSSTASYVARGRGAHRSRGARQLPATARPTPSTSTTTASNPARGSVAGRNHGQSRARPYQNRGQRRGGAHRSLPTHPRTIRCLLHGRLSPCPQCNNDGRFHPYNGSVNIQSRIALQEHYRAQPVQQPRQAHNSATINLLTTNMIMQAQAVKINVDFNQLRDLLINSEAMVWIWCANLKISVIFFELFSYS